MNAEDVCICGHERKWHGGDRQDGPCHSGIRPCQRKCSSFIKTTTEREIARRGALEDAIIAIQNRIDVLYGIRGTSAEGRNRFGLIEAREILKRLAQHEAEPIACLQCQAVHPQPHHDDDGVTYDALGRFVCGSKAVRR